jgi:tRNA A-37 threonylcarbamoyl transferase component Bud32
MVAPVLSGVVFDGRFRIDARVAEGGFAVVYKACQVALDRQVALKVLKTPVGYDHLARSAFRDKFASEARTIASLRHPQIVDVYDFSISTLASGELAPWMALEWLEGETLGDYLERRRGEGRGPFAPGEAVAFLRPVIEALAYAHRQGIVHRDVKPTNLMVTETAAGRPMLRILDFGIAKIMRGDAAPSTGSTRTDSTPMFSPSYAAPEQVAFSRTGPWTDVHAIGLLLCELMTGWPPFSDTDPNAHLFEQVMARNRPTPAARGIDAGPFEAIIVKALALSPKDRWRTAGELLQALDGASQGRATAVLPVEPAPRGATDVLPVAPLPGTRPRAGRTPALVAVAAALVAGVAVVAVNRISRTSGGRERPHAPTNAQAIGAPAPVTLGAIAPPAPPPTSASVAAPGPRPAATPVGADALPPPGGEPTVPARLAQAARAPRARPQESHPPPIDPPRVMKGPSPAPAKNGERDLFDEPK